MPKPKIKWLKLFNLSSLFLAIVLSACTTNNSNTSSNNEWSLPSQKPGLIHAPNNLLTQANQELVVGNYFKLSLKPEAEKMNPWLLTNQLNKSLNNSNDKPFNGQETITNDFSTFNKAALLNKYFVNENNFFPTWFVYDIRASVINQKINLLVTMVDTDKLSSASNYQVNATFNFESTYQTPAISELIKSTIISVDNPDQLLASNVQTSNLKVANQTELTNNGITVSYSDLQPNDQTATLTVKLTLTDSAKKTVDETKTVSGFIKFDAADMLVKLKSQNLLPVGGTNINVNTIKTRIDKYKDVMSKTSETEYSKITSSPALAWAYAVEMSATNANESNIKTKINNIADLTENKNASKLDSLYPYLVNLTGIAFVLGRNTSLASGTQKDDVQNTLKAVVNDYLTTYYYGVKNSNGKQKIYKNSEVYEYQTPLALATIFYWKANLFDQATYKKLNDAINYFLPNVSKVGASDGSRYVMDSAPTSQSINSFNQILHSLLIRLVSGSLDNQANEVNLAIQQFGDWMNAAQVNPTETNNAFHENKSSTDNAQNWILFLNRMDFLRKLHPSFVASKLLINYVNIYTKLITYAKETLFKTVITKDNVDDDTHLKLVGIFNIISRNARLANQLEPVLKALFVGKTETNLTKFNSLNWSFIKTEIKRLLPVVKS